MKGKYPPAFLLLFGMPAVEDHAIAGLEWSDGPQAHPVAFDASHLAEKDTALLSKAGMNQFLVVDAAEPAGVKPAGKGHLQVVLSRAGSCLAFDAGRSTLGRLLQRLPINPRDVRHVFRRFEPAFDLQRTHPAAHQFRQHFQTRQILLAEQILAIAQRYGLAVAD